jgi:hypothetical protein
VHKNYGKPRKKTSKIIKRQGSATDRWKLDKISQSGMIVWRKKKKFLFKTESNFFIPLPKYS